MSIVDVEFPVFPSINAYTYTAAFVIAAGPGLTQMYISHIHVPPTCFIPLKFHPKRLVLRDQSIRLSIIT